MSLLSEAVAAVITMSDDLIRSLDDAAAEARRANIDATRDALRNLVPVDDPMRPVAELIAATLKVGRESDGFPERSVSPDAVTVYEAAIRALGYTRLPDLREGGLLAILSRGIGPDARPLIDLGRVAIDEHETDFHAWCTAKDARKAVVALS